MKKLFYLALLLIAASIASRQFKPDDRPAEVVFKESMNFAKWQTYQVANFNFSFEYPSFFTKEADDGQGNVRLGYHNHFMDLVMECHVQPCANEPKRERDIISTGQLPDHDGYRFFSHKVLHDNRWHSLTLYYPHSCHEGAARIMHSIKKWQPFSHKKLFQGNEGQPS